MLKQTKNKYIVGCPGFEQLGVQHGKISMSHHVCVRDQSQGPQDM